MFEKSALPVILGEDAHQFFCELELNPDMSLCPVQVPGGLPPEWGGGHFNPVTMRQNLYQLAHFQRQSELPGATTVSDPTVQGDALTDTLSSASALAQSNAARFLAEDDLVSDKKNLRPTSLTMADSPPRTVPSLPEENAGGSMSSRRGALKLANLFGTAGVANQTPTTMSASAGMQSWFAKTTTPRDQGRETPDMQARRPSRLETPRSKAYGTSINSKPIPNL